MKLDKQVDLFVRYAEESKFHALVDEIYYLLMEEKYTTRELKDAAAVADIKRRIELIRQQKERVRRKVEEERREELPSEVLMATVRRESELLLKMLGDRALTFNKGGNEGMTIKESGVLDGNCRMRNGVRTFMHETGKENIKDLIRFGEKKMLQIPNFGVVSLKQLKSRLSGLGLRLKK